MHETDLEDEASDVVSRSQRKRDAQVLFRLGQLLVEMPPGDLEQMPIPPAVLEQVMEARAIKSYGAKKRQLLFLAKHLRVTDTAQLEAAVADHMAAKVADRGVQHRIERWRDHVLESGVAAINQLSGTYQGLDRQRLRGLLRKALAETERGQPPSAARELFRELRRLDETSPLPEPE